MKIILILVGSLSFAGVSFAQVKPQPEIKNVQSTDFEGYCKKNALSYIDIAPEKSDVQFNGELPALSIANPTYLDYGIVLKENEAQYFKITGSNKVIKVESLYRLRLGYNQKK